MPVEHPILPAPHAFNIDDVSEEIVKYSSSYLIGTCMVATKHASPIMRKQQSDSSIDNSSKRALQAELATDPHYFAPTAGLSNNTKSVAMQSNVNVLLSGHD